MSSHPYIMKMPNTESGGNKETSRGNTKSRKALPNDDQHPFGVTWLDSCYQETLLPDGPWQQVNKSALYSLEIK